MMTVQASKSVSTIDEIDPDAPIFDSQAFRLNDEQAAIIATARELGQTVFAGRAAAYDRDARFPTENYRDLHRAGLLGIAIPRKHGGLGADYQTYAIAAAEIGPYCGATALTWNMHVCSTLWSLALPANADGISVVGDWDPRGMRGTVSRTLLFKDVFVAEDAALMPRGVYFQAAMRWPHMFLTLSPTYVGLAQGAYDFTVRYLRGEVPGTPPVKRRMYPTKQIALAQIQIKSDQVKALWLQAIPEARANPTKEQLLRAYAS